MAFFEDVNKKLEATSKKGKIGLGGLTIGNSLNATNEEQAASHLEQVKLLRDSIQKKIAGTDMERHSFELLLRERMKNRKERDKKLFGIETAEALGRKATLARRQGRIHDVLEMLGAPTNLTLPETYAANASINLKSKLKVSSAVNTEQIDETRSDFKQFKLL